MRLFFALEIHAPWPQKLSSGRVLAENDRHLTLAFLGDVELLKLQNALIDFPNLKSKLGIVGQFDQCLFLPFSHPRVVAWHIKWQEPTNPLLTFQKKIVEWLEKKGFSLPKNQDFLAHVTCARAPFDKNEWKEAFSPLPCFAGNIHLFESLGDSKYKSLWHKPLLSPFEEMDHIADIAYLIRGQNLSQLYTHAFTALCFSYPSLLTYYLEKKTFEEIEDVVIALNEIVSLADQQIGCPFKAVSFHGRVKSVEKDLLEWEMIVDV
jgi:2'-5' RNA ligase